MGIVTFTGPIKAGNVLNTTGTTAGTVKNVGFAMMAQTYSLTQAGTATATAPAATAALQPACESSNTSIPAGSTASRRAAVR